MDAKKSCVKKQMDSFYVFVNVSLFFFCFKFRVQSLPNLIDFFRDMVGLTFLNKSCNRYDGFLQRGPTTEVYRYEFEYL